MARKPLYYGWILVGVGLVCYGFGISPAYYSWGFFGPELRDEIGLSREQAGSVFGVFQFVFMVVGPLVGMAIARFGLRSTITVGSLTAALGFWLLSRAETLGDCYLSYALIGGLGIGFSTILPGQTLASYWFERYRARAMAVIFTGGALVGMAVNPFNAAMLRGAGWREAWVVIAWVSVVVAVIAAILVRNNPEDLGLQPDGRTESDAEGSGPAGAEARRRAGPAWTAAQAIRTPQFAIITLAGLAYSVPWGVVSAHGGLYVRDELAIDAIAAGLILGTVRVGASAFGRLSGSAADFLSAQRVLALALFVEAIGVAVMAAAKGQLGLYLAVVLLGTGFGGAYIVVPVVFANFFGRQAFATTTGTRIMINGVFGYLGPRLAGRFADSTGTYTSTFWGLAVITLVGAVAAYLCRAPRHPGATGEQAAVAA